MKAKELIKILETNPEMEVLSHSRNPETWRTLVPAALCEETVTKKVMQFRDMMDGDTYTSEVWVHDMSEGAQKVFVTTEDYFDCVL
jgi:hypothetical protein